MGFLGTDLVPMYRGTSSLSQVTMRRSVGSCLTRQGSRTIVPLLAIWSSGPLTILVGSVWGHKKRVTFQAPPETLTIPLGSA